MQMYKIFIKQRQVLLIRLISSNIFQQTVQIRIEVKFNQSFIPDDLAVSSVNTKFALEDKIRMVRQYGGLEFFEVFQHLVYGRQLFIIRPGGPQDEAMTGNVRWRVSKKRP